MSRRTGTAASGGGAGRCPVRMPPRSMPSSASFSSSSRPGDTLEEQVDGEDDDDQVVEPADDRHVVGDEVRPAGRGSPSAPARRAFRPLGVRSSRTSAQRSRAYIGARLATGRNAETQRTRRKRPPTIPGPVRSFARGHPPSGRWSTRRRPRAGCRAHRRDGCSLAAGRQRAGRRSPVRRRARPLRERSGSPAAGRPGAAVGA